MDRRKYLMAFGVTVTGLLSGCSTGEYSDEQEVDGEIVLDREFTGNGEYMFSAHGW